MTQAARSGRSNLIEGSENAATSKETELKLLGVARASLAELLGDYEMWLAFSNQLPWSKEESAPVFGIRLDPLPDGDDIIRNSAVHARAQRSKFARWLDESDSCVRANCLLVLIRRAILVIRRQIEGLGDEFAKTGGLREQMSAIRRDARNRQLEQTSTDDAPLCPKCGKPMRKRTKRDTGEQFWGCSAYAEGCRGTRPMA